MSRRVLIVDDDDMIREVAKVSLELEAWEVLAAASGAEAVAMAAAERPDAILLDVMMPGMDGPATLAALRAQEATRSIPVIFLTARVQRGQLGELRVVGVQGVLEKPFDPITLANRVAAALGWA